MGIGCRRRRNGRRRQGADRPSYGFRQASRFPKARPTTLAIHGLATTVTLTIWGRLASMCYSTSAFTQTVTRVRWDILHPTAMAFMTWLGMRFIGAGIGIGRMPAARRPILMARRPAF